MPDRQNFIRVPAWAQYPWLQHAFSTRTGAVSTIYNHPCDLNLGLTQDDAPANVIENRRLTEAVGNARLLNLRQIHSNTTHIIRDPDLLPTEGDGLITQIPGLLLGVLTADCVPILIADTETRTVAAFHAGWRGTVAGIVEQGIARMQTEYGSHPDHLVAAVGPAIGVCCYQVGDEVRQHFTEAFLYASDLFTEQNHVDLAEANRRQLLTAGLTPKSIWTARACTACAPERFFSHRAQQGITGRMMSVIGTT